MRPSFSREHEPLRGAEALLKRSQTMCQITTVSHSLGPSGWLQSHGCWPHLSCSPPPGNNCDLAPVQSATSVSCFSQQVEFLASPIGSIHCSSQQLLGQHVWRRILRSSCHNPLVKVWTDCRAAEQQLILLVHGEVQMPRFWSVSQVMPNPVEFVQECLILHLLTS